MPIDARGPNPYIPCAFFKPLKTISLQAYRGKLNAQTLTGLAGSSIVAPENLKGKVPWLVSPALTSRIRNAHSYRADICSRHWPSHSLQNCEKLGIDLSKAHGRPERGRYSEPDPFGNRKMHYARSKAICAVKFRLNIKRLHGHALLPWPASPRRSSGSRPAHEDQRAHPQGSRQRRRRQKTKPAK
jgi:hypothetical protein